MYSFPTILWLVSECVINNVEIERQALSGGSSVLIRHLLAVFEGEAVRPNLVRPRALGGPLDKIAFS